MALVVKEPPANAADVRDMGSVPGLGQSPGGGSATHSRFLPGESHGQRSLGGGLESMGSHRVGQDWSDLTRMHSGLCLVGQSTSRRRAR